jgi:hypothetical protein
MTTTPSSPDHPHYAWGPSASTTWRKCAGAMNYIAEETQAGNILPEVESPFAAEGTKAHDYAERVLTGEIQPDEVPGEFWEHLEGYVSFANKIASDMSQGKQVEVMNEQQVPLFYSPDNTGTLDYGVVAEDGSEVAILDLKYGVGIYVPVKDNSQLAIYALSLMQDLKSNGYAFTGETKVSIYIYQPRHRDFTGEPESWVLSYKELLSLSLDIKETYIHSLIAVTTDRTASTDACRWCKAKVICPTRNLELFEMIPTEANPLIPANQSGPHLPEVRLLNDTARVAVYRHHKEIIKWLNDVTSDTLAQIESGKAIEGLKTVDSKRGNRLWDAEDSDLSSLLRKVPISKRYKPRQLLSPAAIERVLHQEGEPLETQSKRFQTRWKEFIKQSPSKPALALASDPKPARQISSIEFGDIEEEEEITEADCF